MATTEKLKVRIVWNGMGGELDSVVVTEDGDQAITSALDKLVQGNIVSPGDTFEIQALS